MNLYQTLVLLHVVATGGVFAGLGIEVAALRRLQSAGATDEVRAWLPSLERPAGMLPHVSMAVLVLTGLGLAVQRGGLTPWMTASLVAIVLMVLLVMTLTSAPLTRLATALAEEGAAAAGWARLAHDPALHWSLWLRVGLYLGVLGLMSLKPATVGSALVLAAGVILGAVVGRLDRGRVPTAVGG